MLDIVFRNHFYMFKNNIYLQSDKGPIGLRFSGSLARNILIYFDFEFIRITKQLKIELLLYKRYVDDINYCLEKIKLGYVFSQENNTLYYNHDQYMSDITNSISSEKKTSDILQQISNYIIAIIQWETDSPDNYEDRHLPVLDLKMKLVKTNR